MTLRTVALLAALTSLAFAGCVSTSDEPAASGTALDGILGLAPEPFVNPIDLDHDHGDLSLHTLSNNVDLVGHVDFGLDPTVTLGEVDTAGDYAYVAVFGHGVHLA